MTMAHEDLIARSIRVRMALAMVPAAEVHRSDLYYWVANAGAALADEHGDGGALAVTVSSDLGSMCLTLTVPRASGAWVGNELDGAPRDERERFQAFCAALATPTIGHWIDVAGDEFDRGWLLTGRLALAAVTPLLAINPKRDAIVAACEALGLDEVVRVSRSFGAGNPFTELRIALPADRKAALAATRDVFIAAKIALPLGFSTLFADTRPTQLAVRLTERGVSRLGVLGIPDDTRAVVAFCMASRARDPLAIAEVEGVLGADGPDLVEYFTRAGGIGVDLHYTTATVS